MRNPTSFTDPSDDRFDDQSADRSVAGYSKKVCLLGELDVGKTSLVRRFVHDIYDEKVVGLNGVKVSRKTVAVMAQAGVAELAMMLWDTGSSEEFSQIRASYLRGAAGVVLVCDLTRPDTLEQAKGYAQILRQELPHAKLILAANKVDLVDQRRTGEAEIRSVAAALEIPFVLTSAKTGQGVEAIFRTLGSLLIGG